jgi:DNA-binding protein YbaB
LLFCDTVLTERTPFRRYAMFGGDVGPGDQGFDIHGLIELQDRARRISAGMTQVANPDLRAKGWDGARAVRVTVDNSGGIVDVEVGLSWRDVLAPAELGAAVVEAVNAAEAERMDAWERATKEEPEPWAPDFADLPTASPRDPAVLESTRALYYLAMDAIDRLSEVSQTIGEAPAETVRGQSPGKRVTITADGGRVVDVEFDESWLSQTSQTPAVEISRHLRAAFDAVEQAGPRHAAAEALDNPTIREFREATADPAELLRRLGLTGGAT